MTRVFGLIGYTCGLNIVHGLSDGHNVPLLLLAIALTGLNVLGVLLP